MRRRIPLLVSLSLPAALGAQQRPAPRDSTADSARARLAALVTTARRYPVRADATPQKIDVVTRADIERTAATDVVDALKKVAAVDVVQYPTLLGGVGVRGFRPQTGFQQRTLVLFDGRPAGVYNLALVDLGDVERIEVLKGPSSALYGSGAMGGVVNIVTRRSAGRPQASLTASAGSFRQTELALRAGGTIGGRLDGDLSLRRFAQDADFRTGAGNLFRDALGGDETRKIYLDGRRPTRTIADTLGDGQVRPSSTFSTLGGSARLGAALGDGFRLDVRGEGFRSDDALSPGDVYATRFVTGPNGVTRVNTQDARKDTERGSAEVALRGTRGRHAPLVRVFAAREREDNYSTPADTGFVNFAGRTTTTGAQLQDVVQLGAHTLTLGADWNRARSASQRFSRAAGRVTEIGTFSPNGAIESLAGFAEARAVALDGRVVATAGARVDRITLALEETPLRPDVRAGSETFAAFTPNAGVQGTLGGGVRAHASVGRAFLAPPPSGRAGLVTSINTTTNVANVTAGNATLRPEASVTWDAGLAVERPRAGLDADVTYFRTTVDDRITTASATFAATRRPTLAGGAAVNRVTTSVNADAATIEGLEARLGWDVGALLGAARSVRLFANATRLFRAEERVRTASIDTARVAGQQDFDPARLAGAFDFGPATTRPIYNVATLTANYGVEYDDRRRFSARLTGRFVGTRRDVDFTDFADVSDVEYPPFMVLDLVAGVRVTPRYRVDAVVANATDENYYEKRGYNMPGRAVTVRVTAGL